MTWRQRLQSSQLEKVEKTYKDFLIFLRGKCEGCKPLAFAAQTTMFCCNLQWETSSTVITIRLWTWHDDSETNKEYCVEVSPWWNDRVSVKKMFRNEECSQAELGESEFMCFRILATHKHQHCGVQVDASKCQIQREKISLA
jgi:hypothetical protein